MTLCASGARRGQEKYWDIMDGLARQAVANVEAKCLEALTMIARHLDDLGALRPGTSTAQAADMLWFYFGPNAWCSLVGERGWTFDQAEQWLLHAASRDILPGRTGTFGPATIRATYP